MLNVHLNETEGIAVLVPMSRLDESGSERVCDQIDPLIGKIGKSAGLIIKAGQFPGWESFCSGRAESFFLRG